MYVLHITIPFVMKSVLSYSLLFTTLFLAACSVFSNNNSGELRVDIEEEFQLRIGESATFRQVDHMFERETEITFQALNGDSRCPLRVECFWEGEINALFSAATEGEVEQLDYKDFLGIDGKKPLRHDFEVVYDLLLIRIDPYPGEDDDAEVVATLKVVKVRVLD